MSSIDRTPQNINIIYGFVVFKAELTNLDYLLATITSRYIYLIEQIE